MLDAAIVGAGHNGLVAAAYLARAGLSVTCFERRDVAGGACVTEELWPGVRGSPGAYTLSLLRAQIIDDLQLGAHGLSVSTHEPYLFAPLPDGRRVVTWSSRARTREQLARDWSQGDADGYGEWADRWEAAAARARPLMLEPASRERWLEAIGPEILDGSIADDLAGIPSEEVRVPFAVQGLIGTLAGPSDPGTAFVGFFHDLGEAAGEPGAWGFAQGGMGAVTAALRSAAEAAGAVIQLDRPVDHVRVEDGRATGLVLTGGDEVEARAVLSNADPVRTAALAGCDPPDGWRTNGPVVKVMVQLDGLPDFPAWPGPDPWAGTVDIGFSLDDLETAAADARAGRPAQRPWIEAACQTAADPTLAPEGAHVLSMFCQCFPPDVDAAEAADLAIARFAEVCPDFPDRIVDRLALGPRELEARFGLTGGHIFHGEMLPGQLLESRPAARAFGGVEGLYLAGSGAHPGGAVTGAPGYLAARAVIEDLGAEGGVNRALDLIRPHPHRGDIIAMGIVPLTLAVIVSDIRMDSAWSDLVHVLFAYALLAFVHGMAMLAPLEREQGPRAYHSVLLISGLFLAALAIYRLGRLFGVDNLANSAGGLTWSLALFAGYALAGAVAKRSAICTLAASLALGGGFLASCDLVFDIDGLATYRTLLLIPLVVFALRSLGLREHYPRHSVGLVNAAGVAALAIGVINLFETRAWGWQLIVLACGFALIAYAATDRENGSAYLGAVVLAVFAYSVVQLDFPGGPSLLGWPLALLLMSLLGLGLGLRPRRDLPPPPDAEHPDAETVPLPGAQRADRDLGL